MAQTRKGSEEDAGAGEVISKHISSVKAMDQESQFE
jgi:hypothetical protein